LAGGVSLKGTYNDTKGRWELVVNKDMDLYAVPELKQAILACISEKKADIYLDATDMGYIDSTGLGVLVSSLNKVREYGGSMTIKGLKPHIRRIFHLTGLDGAFGLEG
jgi:anti-sigma B factor antagonist